MEIKFVDKKVTFGQLKFGGLFLYPDEKSNTVYMKINCISESENCVNLYTGDTTYMLHTNYVIPLSGELEVTKI